MPSEKAATGERGWLTSAPPELKALCNGAGHARSVLDRLLRDPRMDSAWIEIGKRIPKELDYAKLWRAIWSAYVHSGRNESQAERKRKNKRRMRIVKRVRELAELLREDGGWFDCLGHQLYPGKVEDLARSKSLASRYREACNALEWTSISELLDALTLKASIEPPAWAVVKKTSIEHQSNWFIRELAPFFSRWFPGPQEALLAAIASATLARPPDKSLESIDVARSLAPGKRRTAKASKT